MPVLTRRTPLLQQNNLNELFTLLSFILPHVFTDEAAFIEMFNFKAVTSGTSLELSEQAETSFLAKILTEILTPFTLRRRKKDVVKDLPLKKECVSLSHRAAPALTFPVLQVHAARPADAAAEGAPRRRQHVRPRLPRSRL